MLYEVKEGTILEVMVVIKSSKTEFVSFENYILKIRLKAIPEKGKANEELLKYLKKIFKTTAITLTFGKTSRLKKVLISNFSKEEVLKILLLL